MAENPFAKYAAPSAGENPFAKYAPSPSADPKPIQGETDKASGKTVTSLDPLSKTFHAAPVFQPIHDVTAPLAEGAQSLKEHYKEATAPEKPSLAGMIPGASKKDRATLAALGDAAGLGLQGLADLTGVGEALNVGAGTLSRALSRIPGAKEAEVKGGHVQFKTMPREEREATWRGAIDKGLMAVPGEGPAAAGARRGAKLAKAAAKTAGDPHAADVNLLHGEGVRMTPGQIRGGAHRDLESKRTSSPTEGHAIREAEHRSVGDFNRALYNRTLGLIGKAYPKDGPVGMKGAAAINKALSDEYERLKPHMSAGKDAAFDSDIAAARGLAGVKGSREADEFDNLIKTRVDPHFKGGATMNGEAFKELESYISGQANSLRGGDAYQKNLAEAYDGVLAALRGSLERHSAPDIRPQLEKLNSAWAASKTLEDAAYAGKASDGVFTPNQYLSALGKGGARYRRMVARGQGRWQDFVQAAQRVLPNKIADSGTEGRRLANKGTFRGIGAAAGGGLGAALGLHHGGAPFIVGEGGLGAGVGGHLGGILDRELAPVTNPLALKGLDRRAGKQAERLGIPPPGGVSTKPGAVSMALPAMGALDAALNRRQDDEQ